MKKKQNFFADVLSTVTKYFLIFIAVIIVYLLCSGIRVIKSGNVALVLRFGKIAGNTQEEQIHQPGLLFAFPYFIDEVVVIPSGEVIEQRVTTHYTEPDITTRNSGGYLITGDQNIAVVSASVKYVVSNPVSYALHVNDIEKIINATVSTAMINESARIGVDDLLTSGKDKFGRNVLDFAMDKLDMLDVGINITSLELTHVSMPAEVKDIYDEVNATTVRAETIIDDARLYRENLLPNAEGISNQLISNANSLYSTTVGEAKTEMSGFWGNLEEFKTNPELVKKRIYSKKFAVAINRIANIRVVRDGETQIIINP